MDEANQVVNEQATFTLQCEGDKEPGAPVPLDVMLESNRDDPTVAEWLKRALPGGSLITAGGAAPRVSIRRVT